MRIANGHRLDPSMDAQEVEFFRELWRRKVNMTTEYDDACGHSPNMTQHVKRLELWRFCDAWLHTYGVERASDLYDVSSNSLQELAAMVRSIVQHEDSTDE